VTWRHLDLLPTLAPGVSRRFLVPKGKLSYRQATQLEPQDALVLTAIMHEHGAGMEARRLASDRVFSYRSAPTGGALYQETPGWNQCIRLLQHRMGNQYVTAVLILEIDGE
jgi:hypothetical protein